MKSTGFFLVLIFFTSAICLAQEATYMEDDLKLAEPGPEHERLQLFEGEWNVLFKYWPAPGQDVIEGAGTSSNKMILGGRFLEMRGEVQMMGMTAASFQIMGYDKRTQKYTIVGFDDHGTYYVTGEGDYNESNKTYTLTGSDSLITPGRILNFRYVIKVTDNDNFVFEFYFDQPDKNFYKGVEIAYKRKA